VVQPRILAARFRRPHRTGLLRRVPAQTLLLPELPESRPPLWEKLRYAIPANVLSQITPARLRGAYRRGPVESGLQQGSITADSRGKLRWTNRAGKSWGLELYGDKRLLLTGPRQSLPQVRSGGQPGLPDRPAPRPERGIAAGNRGFQFLGDFQALFPPVR